MVYMAKVSTEFVVRTLLFYSYVFFSEIMVLCLWGWSAGVACWFFVFVHVSI